MPIKIPLTQMRDWLESYEKGKSEAAIAKKAERGVGTVKRGIDQARRERDARAVRAELLKDALQRHQDDLVEILDSLKSALVVPPLNLQLPVGRNVKRSIISLAQAELRYTTEKGLITQFGREDTYQWKSLREHLKRDRMWKALDLWKEAVVANIKARLALKRKAIVLLEGKTVLKLIHDIDKAPEEGYIYNAAVELFYQVVVNQSLGIQDGEVIDERTIVASDPYARHTEGGPPLVYAPGKVEECRKQVPEAFIQLLNGPERKDFDKTYDEIKIATAEARTHVEKLSILRFIPGSCWVCRRLGM